MLEPRKLIQSIGLNKKEVEIYLALLALGPATPAQVARHAEIKRPTTYVLLEGLAEKGFVSRVSGRPKKFKAEHPEKLKVRLRESLATFERSMPWLMSLVNKEKEMPSVRFFKGLKEVKAAYNESLLLPPGSTILAFGSTEAVITKLKGFIEVYLKERTNRKIKVRAIMQLNRGTLITLPKDKQQLRETRILEPSQFDQEAEIDIYGNKVFAISLEGNNFVAIILESKIIAATLRQMFEVIWKIARPAIAYLKIKD